ncbi:unnamed protein product [Vicia faba]|uniref:Uncharacterized protein n=1 Tax=Vicia faba TaxID=3906 RepID=A0AAV0YIM4_VICFA|nr:unnamed protein product [Vicia faba]
MTHNSHTPPLGSRSTDHNHLVSIKPTPSQLRPPPPSPSEFRFLTARLFFRSQLYFRASATSLCRFLLPPSRYTQHQSTSILPLHILQASSRGTEDVKGLWQASECCVISSGVRLVHVESSKEGVLELLDLYFRASATSLCRFLLPPSRYTQHQSTSILPLHILQASSRGTEDGSVRR